MINLFQFQAVSCIAYLTLLMLLLICPYQGEEFRTYHRVRRIFMFVLLTASLQFGIQMIFGFRSRDILLGAMTNMGFIFCISQLCNMSLFTMMKPFESTRKDWLVTSGATLINIAILTIGVLANQGQWQQTMLMTSIAFYALFDVIMLLLQFRLYRRIHNNLQEFYSTPVEEHTEWIKIYLVVRSMIFISLPLVLLNNLWAVIFSSCTFISFAYFVAKFMYYGYYVKFVERAEESLSSTQESPSNDVTSNGLQSIYQPIEQAIQQWVEERGYCDSNITLDSLEQRLNIRRKGLSQYIKRQTSGNFRDWLNTLRVEYAKTLIAEQPGLSFEQIAEKSGFTNRSYFDVVFKDKVGCTPAVWRHREEKPL